MLAIFLSGQQTFAQTASPSILFTPEQVTQAVGTEFSTELSINTQGNQVGGVGAKVRFDPMLLEVTRVETLPLFPDYPASSFDNVKGTVTISGIVRSKEELYTGTASFAKVYWKAKKAGLTTIQLLYEPNSTKDSNIAVLYGNGDILEKVNSVSVEITGGSDQTHLTPSDQSQMKGSQEQKMETSFDIWAEVQKQFPVLLLVLLMLSLSSHVFLFWKMNAIEKKMAALTK